MKGDSGLVFNIQRFSVEDGPGIRTTVFFKGCSLRCPWCHNPEGLSSAPEIMFGESKCMSCMSCLDACPFKSAQYGSEICEVCGRCAEACPTGARQVVGQEMTVDEVRELMLRDRVFYESAQGGVTFSGGEPLQQPDFLYGCLQAARAEGVHTVVDTSGFGARRDVLRIAESTDLILFDLKILDERRHQEVIGVPLAPILENLDSLIEIGQKIWLRVPVVPGFTDSLENLSRIRDRAEGSSAIEKLCLLPYHARGAEKHRRLFAGYDLDGIESLKVEDLQELVARLDSPKLVVGG